MPTDSNDSVQQKPASAADTLRAAKALIEDKAAWLQGGIARDRAHRYVHPTSPSAVRWCMIGAVKRVDGPFEDAALDTLESVVPKRDIGTFNDRGGRRHSTIMAAFDKAIAKAEGNTP